jgi:hypothetical protein
MKAICGYRWNNKTWSRLDQNNQGKLFGRSHIASSKQCRSSSSSSEKIYGIYWHNRTTPTVVSAGSRAEAISKANQKKKKGYGKLRGAKRLNERDSKTARQGGWVRTRHSGESPQKSSEKSGYRPWLHKRSDALEFGDPDLWSQAQAEVKQAEEISMKDRANVVQRKRSQVGKEHTGKPIHVSSRVDSPYLWVPSSECANGGYWRLKLYRQDDTGQPCGKSYIAGDKKCRLGGSPNPRMREFGRALKLDKELEDFLGEKDYDSLLEQYSKPAYSKRDKEDIYWVKRSDFKSNGEYLKHRNGVIESIKNTYPLNYFSEQSLWTPADQSAIDRSGISKEKGFRFQRAAQKIRRNRELVRDIALTGAAFAASFLFQYMAASHDYKKAQDYKYGDYGKWTSDRETKKHASSWADNIGVKKNASDEEVKRAYRNKAREYHPDLNPNNKDAEQKMKDLNNSYEYYEKYVKKQQRQDSLYAKCFARA